MKIRFNDHQWRNFLFIYWFAKWKYGTTISPHHFVTAFPMMYDGIK